MDTQAQDVRNATDAVAMVLDCVAKVRCLVDYHGLDDQLDRLGPMLTNYIAVVFASEAIVAKAADALRGSLREPPPSIGDCVAPSYHELALRLAEEPLWRLLSGMDGRGMSVMLRTLSGLDPRPTGSIAVIEGTLNGLGGVSDPAAAIAELRSDALTQFDIDWLRSCVLKEGAIAGAATAAGQTQSLGTGVTPEFPEMARKILHAMLAFDAVDKDSRVRRIDVVTKVTGTQNADQDSLNRSFDCLRNRELIVSSQGRGGGIWLTEKGLAAAKAITSTPDKSQA